MSALRRRFSKPAPAAPGGYFVGRRPHEAAEVYLVERNKVERLDSHGFGAVGLDWRSDTDELLKLSRILLARAGGPAAPLALEMHFAHLIGQFPEDGFVLGTDTVAGWLRDALDCPSYRPEPRQRSLLEAVRERLRSRHQEHRWA